MPGGRGGGALGSPSNGRGTAGLRRMGSREKYQAIVDDRASAIEGATSQDLEELRDVISSLLKTLEMQVETKDAGTGKE